MSDLGKLKDAELSTRKAIELKPDFTKAINNLGALYLSSGKHDEAMNIYNKVFYLKSSKDEDEDIFKANVYLMMSALAKGDFAIIPSHINKGIQIINNYAFKKENKLSKSFIKLIYSHKYIERIYSDLEKSENKNSTKKIPHIGESHSLTFSQQTIKLFSEERKIQSIWIPNCKSWHFAKEEMNQYKASFLEQYNRINDSNEVLISFGEIDCRKTEGILYHSIKYNKSIISICERTINGYLNYMEKNLSKHYSKRFYFGVPAATRVKELLDDLDIKRIKMIKLYNSILKKEVLSRGSYFLDVYNLTSNKNGENNHIYMCDDTHLSPKCLSVLFENYLNKP